MSQIKPLEAPWWWRADGGHLGLYPWGFPCKGEGDEIVGLKGLRKCRIIWAVPNRAVFCTMLNFSGDIADKFLLIPLVTDPSAPITTGIVYISFKFQHFCTSISKSRYFVIFSASFFTI